MDGALLWRWVVFRKKRVASEGFCMAHGKLPGVRKRGRGGRALPRPDRAANLAANTRLFWNLPDWPISRTHTQLIDCNTMRL